MAPGSLVAAGASSGMVAVPEAAVEDDVDDDVRRYAVPRPGGGAREFVIEPLDDSSLVFDWSRRPVRDH